MGSIEGGVRRNFNPDKRAEESEVCVFKNAPLMISNSDPEEWKQYYIETRKYNVLYAETAFSNKVSSTYTYRTAQPATARADRSTANSVGTALKQQ